MITETTLNSQNKLDDEKKIVLKDFPFTISLEASAFCNYKCVMCENPTMKRKKGNMKMEILRKCADEIKNYPNTRIYLSGYGEPLLNKEVFDEISYCSSVGIKNTFLNTNGMLLNDEAAVKLIRAGLHCLIISIDGFTKETYESIRVGGDRDIVYANAVNYLKRLKELGTEDQILEVQFIEMNKTLPEKDMWLDFWMKQGANIKIKPYLEWGGVKRSGDEIKGNYKERLACEICNEFMIMWNGDVALCTAGDIEITHVLGNIMKDSIQNYWEKKKEIFSNYHINHDFDKLPEFCKNCSNWKIPFAKVIKQ